MHRLIHRGVDRTHKNVKKDREKVEGAVEQGIEHRQNKVYIIYTLWKNKSPEYCSGDLQVHAVIKLRVRWDQPREISRLA